VLKRRLRSAGSGLIDKSMPPKPTGAVPKGWPSGTLYLQSPSFSKTLAKEKIDGLVSLTLDLPPNAQVQRAIGPYSNVRITPVSDASHPADGQHALCATQHLAPDTFILPYLGYVHDQTDTDEASNYDLSLDRELGIGVDASVMGNEARFINDYRGISQAPNAEFRDIFVAISNNMVEKRVGVFVLSAGKSGKRTKGIGRGEELTVSYGKGFWKERQPAQK
jgi:hypothetical protein